MVVYFSTVALVLSAKLKLDEKQKKASRVSSMDAKGLFDGGGSQTFKSCSEKIDRKGG